MEKKRYHHQYWMNYALKMAKRSWNAGEIPVGAILVHDNKIISEGWNQSISRHDPTAHAEIMALRRGGIALKNYRLIECTLYVTLEPCIMCFGAVIQGRINTIVYGVRAEKSGIKDYSINLLKCLKKKYQHKVIGGVLEYSCAKILRDFFVLRRFDKNKTKNKKRLNRYNF